MGAGLLLMLLLLLLLLLPLLLLATAVGVAAVAFPGARREIVHLASVGDMGDRVRSRRASEGQLLPA